MGTMIVTTFGVADELVEVLVEVVEGSTQTVVSPWTTVTETTTGATVDAVTVTSPVLEAATMLERVSVHEGVVKDRVSLETTLTPALASPEPVGEEVALPEGVRSHGGMVKDCRSLETALTPVMVFTQSVG